MTLFNQRWQIIKILWNNGKFIEHYPISRAKDRFVKFNVLLKIFVIIFIQYNTCVHINQCFMKQKIILALPETYIA